MTDCYCSPCLGVRIFNACKNSRFSSVCCIVALGRTAKCLILLLVHLLMSWTRTLGSGSLLYYAVNSCIIHHHQSLMTETEQSPKHHKFTVYWQGRSLNWSLFYSTALKAWNFISNSPFLAYPVSSMLPWSRHQSHYQVLSIFVSEVKVIASFKGILFTCNWYFLYKIFIILIHGAQLFFCESWGNCNSWFS
jgi:hypothetical protein